MHLPNTHRIAKELYLKAAKGTSLEGVMEDHAADRLAQMFTLVMEDHAERGLLVTKNGTHHDES